MGNETLSPRQEQLLSLLGLVIREGRSPAISDLVAQMGFSGYSGLNFVLKPLEKKGYITITAGVKGKEREITLTDKGRAATRTGIPVYGSIYAGLLHEAVQDIEAFVDHVDELVRYKPGDFFLRVKGDSMIGDGIIEGDLVLLRPAVEAQSGEIAAVQIVSETEGYSATLKHIDWLDDGQTARLRASNATYADIIVPASQIAIAGVFRGLVRSSLIV